MTLQELIEHHEQQADHHHGMQEIHAMGRKSPRKTRLTEFHKQDELFHSDAVALLRNLVTLTLDEAAAIDSQLGFHIANH